MNALPQYVYLVTVDGEWPVSSRATDDVEDAARWVAETVARRTQNRGAKVGRAKVHRARLVDVEELDLVPERKLPATLMPRDGAPD